MRHARHFSTAAVLSAAVAGFVVLSTGLAVVTAAPAPPADGRGGGGAPTTQPNGQQADVPVKQVVLFSSGVGYFEHFGTVNGTGGTELRFKTQQINDILKSLVLEDLDKGRVTTITYPSQDPIAKTLRSFQVDITSNPSLGELLNQLRGARVKLLLGGDPVEGTILGLEKKKRPVRGPGDKDGDTTGVADVWVLNLLNGADLRSVELDNVRRVELLDPQLRDELSKALAALSQARDQDKKPVQIHFSGQGQRRVRIGYVVETPVWKTSYRLLLSGPGRGEKPDAPAAGAAATGKGEGEGQVNGQGAGKPQGEGKLQGWAIVENQTDNDWNDVQLSLVSGRPISFIQDLYQPLYVPRPVVQPQLYASLRPQTYDAGMDTAKKDIAAFNAPEAAASVPTAGPGASDAKRAEPMARALRQSLAGAGGAVAGDEQTAQLQEQLGKPLNAAASVSSLASASKVGELFQYTVGSVSLPRQKSAMIPIITDDVDVERLSIYNASVLPRNPLTGARVKNTSGKHLLAGPVTVLDGGTYAGDAEIDNVPPGQERLISYGVDQQVLVDATKNKQESVVQTGKIVKGVLTVSRKHVFTQDYVAENKGDKDKALIIEHPVRPGWALVDTDKPVETTDAVYRFKGSVSAGKGSKLTVKQQIVDWEQVAILPADLGQLESYRRTGEIPQAVRDVLAKAIAMKNAMTDTQRQIQERQQRAQEITTEQTRLRENMKTVAQSTDYYNRLLKKLDEQESQIEKIQKEVQELQKTLERQQKELEDYVNNTTVDESTQSSKK